MSEENFANSLAVKKKILLIALLSEEILLIALPSEEILLISKNEAAI